MKMMRAGECHVIKHATAISAIGISIIWYPTNHCDLAIG